MQQPTKTTVVTLNDADHTALQALLARYGLQLEVVAPNSDIPGSFWGDSEAGLIENRLLARPDTPLHSVLHEACHYICMDAERRSGLHTNAGGNYDEENGVCYLQILLADDLPDIGRERLMQDMDTWGYSFRLGSTARWFAEDADDAHAWLLVHGLINSIGSPLGRLRT